MTDAHLHLHLARVPLEGVSALCTCAVEVDDWERVVESVREAPSVAVVPAFGVHPVYAGDLPPQWKELLEAQLRSFPGALVGEAGLDGRDACGVEMAAQRAVLCEQLEVAARLERKVVLHGAGAWGALFELLEPFWERLPGVLLHGFGASEQLMRRFAERGAYFSFGGMLCNERAVRVRECFKAVPEGRFLLESDADGSGRAGLKEVYGAARLLRDVSGVDSTFHSYFAK